MSSQLADDPATAARQSHGGSSGGKAGSSTTITKIQKINQVIQNLYIKAAQIIIQARQPVSPLYARGSTTKRLNKWFNIETVDTDAFREDLRYWKSLDVTNGSLQSKPLVIEVALLTRDLTPNQSLVLLDAAGRRWDVDNGSRRRPSNLEIVLEKWTIDWEPLDSPESPELPVTYKKSIVVFRSLFALSRILPAWRLRKRLARSKLTGNSLKVLCRVATGSSTESSGARLDLTAPLVDGQIPSSQHYDFHAIETPGGRFHISVDYRIECNFRVDDSEALLSSQFLNSDQKGSQIPESFPRSNSGSRRISRQNSSFTNFDNIVQASSNPVDLRGSADNRPNHGIAYFKTDRRPSATLIQPFKTPSLSASPSLDHLSRSPKSFIRTQSSASMDRNNARMGSTTLPQRVPSSLGDQGSSFSASPRNPPQPPQLIKRYSSSFGQRSSSFSSRRRTSQVSDANVNANTDILSSRASSRSPSTILQIEENDDLGDFVKLLDSRKPLSGQAHKELGSAKDLTESILQRTRLELSKFQVLKDSHTRMTESLMQSTILKNEDAGSSTSRRASNALVGFTSSSPSKSLSPHTPAIPSKLSESSVLPGVSATESSSQAARRTPLSGPPVFTERSTAAVNIPSTGPADLNASQSGDSSGELETLPADKLQADNDARASGPAGVARSNKAPAATAQTQNLAIGTTPVEFGHSSSNRNESPNTSTVYSQDSLRAHKNHGTLRPPFAVARSSPQVEDDDLFFTMSDLHLGQGKSS